jgi:hypothetical protein
MRSKIDIIKVSVLLFDHYKGKEEGKENLSSLSSRLIADCMPDFEALESVHRFLNHSHHS